MIGNVAGLEKWNEGNEVEEKFDNYHDDDSAIGKSAGYKTTTVSEFTEVIAFCQGGLL